MRRGIAVEGGWVGLLVSERLGYVIAMEALFNEYVENAYCIYPEKLVI